MKLEPLIILATLFSLFLVSASIDNIKPTICNSINLTEPNCTTWWNGLNLTDDNLTININITYITQLNNTSVNNTYYQITNITNVTYTGNYTIYNITNNITQYKDFNESNISFSNYYTKSEVDNKIIENITGLENYLPRSEISGIINQTINDTNQSFVYRTVNDIETIWKISLWIVGGVVVLLTGFVIYLVVEGLNG